jgi:hypothetical protein
VEKFAEFEKKNDVVKSFSMENFIEKQHELKHLEIELKYFKENVVRERIELLES